ncbi:MAG TPA: MFS transporter [Burkholderiales bacterium]|nr:MFS transporter [Burkholderiales bacterium]
MYNKRNIILFTIFFVLYETVTYLSNDMIMPAMLLVVNQFHAPVSSIAKSLSFFIIGGSLLQIFLGPIADRFGKRNVMLFGNLLFLLATVLIPFSSSMNQFLLARLFQGMGMCFIFIGYAMIHELLNDVQAVRATSIMANITIFAPLVGPIIGSVITNISSWEYVFIVTWILGLVSLCGLFIYMPRGKILTKELNKNNILNGYKNIFSNKNFLLGIGLSSISLVPIISWIGLSPIIIVKSMHNSFSVYLIYQSIIFAGFILSSVLMQIIAGKFSFYNLIIYGSSIAVLGLFITLIFNKNGNLFIVGMFISAFGIGLYNGPTIRLAMKATGESINLNSATMCLVNGLFLAVGLEIANILCDYYSYSLKTFSIINIFIGGLIIILSSIFAKQYKTREWMV